MVAGSRRSTPRCSLPRDGLRRSRCGSASEGACVGSVVGTGLCGECPRRRSEAEAGRGGGGPGRRRAGAEAGRAPSPGRRVQPDNGGASAATVSDHACPTRPGCHGPGRRRRMSPRAWCKTQQSSPPLAARVQISMSEMLICTRRVGTWPLCRVLHRPRAGAGPDLHNATIQPKPPDRAVSGTWCMRESSRSGRMPSRVPLSRSLSGRRPGVVGGCRRESRRDAPRGNAQALPQPPAVHPYRPTPLPPAH